MYLFACPTCNSGQLTFQSLDYKQFAILYFALMEASVKWTYVDFAYIVQMMHLVNRLRRVPGEGAAGSVALTDGSWQAKDRSRLGSLGYVRKQIEGASVDVGRQEGLWF